MTTDTILYSSNTLITCTLASLASSANAGRSCVTVDNTSTLYIDAILTIRVRTSASALANDKCVYVYIFGVDAAGVISASSAETVGTDTGVTIDTPSNMKGPYVIFCPASSVAYGNMWSIASVFGGVMPVKWGFVIQNYTGQNLDSTEGNHVKEFVGIKYSNA